MNSKGFTLIEVMITLAIVSILAAVAIPLYTGYTNRAKQVEAEEQLMNIAAIEEDYFNTFRDYLTGSWNTRGEKGTETLISYYGAKLDGKYYTIEITKDNDNNFVAEACVCYSGEIPCAPCDVTCTITSNREKNFRTFCTKNN